MSEALRNLYLVVAQDCNLACRYCYAGGGDFGQAARLMDEATLRRGLERLLPLAGERLTVSFFGGEPLMNFPLIETAIARANELAAASGRGLSFALTSNGTLLDDAMLATIKQHISYLAISLDGSPDANAGRPFRDGRPSFASVAANLERLRAAGVAYALRATVTPDNLDHLAQTVDFLAGLGAASVRLLPAQGLAWSPADRQRLRVGLAEINRRGLRAMLDGAPPLACDHACRLLAERVGGYAATRPCLAGGGILALAADGRLYPCEHFTGVGELAMGHIADAELPGPAWRAVAARFAAASTAGRPRCASCGVREACGGQCYAEAHALWGDIETPDPGYCALVRTTYRALEPELAAALADPAQAARLRAAIGA
ncbi:radical SAM protein [Azonexus sp.]|uniref:radical SAM protein n=1 Tax=Azonexus sp. TaxID=1872668 RepID=UPI0035AF73B7